MNATVTIQHGEGNTVYYVMQGDECLESFSTKLDGASAKIRAESFAERVNAAAIAKATE